MEDQPHSANNTRDIGCTTILIPNRITEDEDEDEGHYWSFDDRRIHIVPIFLRENKEDYYIPKFVSFGPCYWDHYEYPQLRTAQKFKHKVLDMFVSSSGKDKQFFYNQIFKVLNQIRNCYAETIHCISRSGWDDPDRCDRILAEMMLLDGCFAIYLIRYHTSDPEIYFHALQHLGIALLPLGIQDMFLVENQIPLGVIMLLIKLINGNEEEGPRLLRKFLSPFVFGNVRLTRFLGEDENPPLHLLDACQRILSEELDSAEERIEESTELTKQNPSVFVAYNHQYGSVTDLKSKGIHFKPSSSSFKFKPHKFYGQLELPVWFFSSFSKLFFTNLIAYELCPGNNVRSINITGYVNFLKSLIVKSEDVKELQEKKIIFSSLDSDEQTLKVIKEIHTYGVNTDHIFYRVKMGIEEHCSSKAKIWIAERKTCIDELIQTYFRSPWSFISLLAATYLLVLTSIQTYYTVNPHK